jgi:hypothetical protein
VPDQSSAASASSRPPARRGPRPGIADEAIARRHRAGAGCLVLDRCGAPQGLGAPCGRPKTATTPCAASWPATTLRGRSGRTVPAAHSTPAPPPRHWPEARRSALPHGQGAGAGSRVRRGPLGASLEPVALAPNRRRTPNGRGRVSPDPRTTRGVAPGCRGPSGDFHLGSGGQRTHLPGRRPPRIARDAPTPNRFAAARHDAPAAIAATGRCRRSTDNAFRHACRPLPTESSKQIPLRAGEGLRGKRRS